ncbi:hypothetical protein FNH22_07665 [Fulvivirga sp. M361]|uniref:VCBS repeat-containing protein n=1 Tax=Fulvivirga sp. M361 TaxID=2594266 RepID=UPI00117B340D|nr:VCBS repeat-containing protein [Fulvivirga sp. M361]TRX59922.1 hypothetical protein FNH22_07665 [Fulvivirga sp. M361]
MAVISTVTAFFLLKLSIPQAFEGQMVLSTLSHMNSAIHLPVFFRYFLIIGCLTFSCATQDADNTALTDGLPEVLFELLQDSITGITFRNQLAINGEFDVFRYRNYYNGGGVAIGDVNNDGLSDIYFTANSTSNKLYLNLGDFRFKDITDSAGVACKKAWSTGVSMVDINGDGFLDIYVCNSGNVAGDDKENELFINNGDLTFTEAAGKVGLDDAGFSTHAVFFDADLDGDLDVYLLNNSFRPVSTFGLKNIRHIRDEKGGDKLYLNKEGIFEDISEKAGIYGSVIGFGLGVSVGFVNNDDLPDIYVSNDFFERDYLYINQGDGMFSEQLPERLGHVSLASMGADIADINNDGHPEIFSTDMLPESDVRLKTTSTFESWDVYQSKLDNDYYHQYMRNMLHLNKGDGTFYEIGQLAGIDATDWSWGALMADFDNDGLKDIIVCNGIYKDVTNQDFLNFLANDKNLEAAFKGEKIDFQQWVDQMPSTSLSNYAFRNKGDLTFDNVTEAWGIDAPTFSNGAAYGDLDNDGDLDLVINNVNQEAFVYRNAQSTSETRRTFRCSLEGENKNRFGIGAQLLLYSNSNIIHYQHFPIKGFQSSMDYQVVVGVGAGPVDSLRVKWPGGAEQLIEAIDLTQEYTLKQTDAIIKPKIPVKVDGYKPYFEEISDIGLDFKHEENEYVDFDTQRLLYNMLSFSGPALTKGDINNDGYDDLFIGGAKGQPGAIYLQSENGFERMEIQDLLMDRQSEDIAALFFDADGDKDLDLYVVSGGADFEASSAALLDRLYLNEKDGSGVITFTKATDHLPAISESGSCVSAADIDSDGDIDLFLGVRHLPGYYGIKPTSYLLENDGTGKFARYSEAKSEALKSIGMITDAIWYDHDGDNDPDLLVVGEWMPLTLLSNEEGVFTATVPAGFENSNGWWNCIVKTDIDHDGDDDFLLGNLGLNSRFKADKNDPIRLYVKDFDGNRSLDHIYTHSQVGREYPMALKHDLEKQVIAIKKQSVYYKDYADKTIDQLFSKEDLENATVHVAYEFRSGVAVNDGNGGFSFEPLPLEAQYAPIYDYLVMDGNSDGIKDILSVGNFSYTKPEIGRYDANDGLYFKGLGKGKFSWQPTAFEYEGDARRICRIKTKNHDLLIVALNDQKPKVFMWKEQER